ncbi:conserved hypothetical protein [Theileria orientalis strain Shintoku]|uniref:Uncharacterized protein n=1 Tax=Theileria orientalis strain Shintoku TaxID=869250 RepID=J4CCU6_THEOR|nr:conserved hypothetical protein [Theileria orientalis strain Shintoku]PVC51143.1 hypothetical protein MACL_00001824 [Theileria orientalis]BAM40007.1 conserved hypothetical protein [Theileria orientalis strain Shintoku]|eukprot:XP_009690308.1 conserved hypothetical protein [Theileria orientalis strain Shintoku]
MANVVSSGFYLSGINNVKIRLYPQVLGIYKIHEHNLCNALRDFGLLIKSDSRRHLLKYNYDFLKFVPLMRGSELCMIAHGYSLLNLQDTVWWDSFTKVVYNSLYDMDGKELAGLLYSLTKVYSTKTHAICKLIEWTKSWIHLFTPFCLSLMVKVATHFKSGHEIMRMLNNRALELIDDLKIVDIVFFMTCNVECRTQEINFFRQMCIKCIELIDDIELHQLRAIVSSLSLGGFKSLVMFNILTIKLAQLVERYVEASNKGFRTPLKEGDVISLCLGFTTQAFLVKNDLCIDTKVYKDFISKNPTSSSNIFKFPLPELGPVLSKGVVDNKTRITANGMPILLRGFSLLEIPATDELMRYLIEKTCKYLDQDEYTGLKLSNLVVTLVKYDGMKYDFWKAVHGTLVRQKDPRLSGDMISKMLNTIFSIGREGLSESRDLTLVYECLLKKCPKHFGDMSVRSILSLTRHFSLTCNIAMLASDEFLGAILNMAEDFSNADMIKILKTYGGFVDKLRSNPKFLQLLEVSERRMSSTSGSKSFSGEQMDKVLESLKSQLD